VCGCFLAEYFGDWGAVDAWFDDDFAGESLCVRMGKDDISAPGWFKPSQNRIHDLK
jgi:hypothetical protein